VDIEAEKYIVWVVVTPAPVIPLFSLAAPVPIAIPHVPLFQILTIGTILPLVPFVIVFMIFVVIASVVMFVSVYRDRGK